MNRSLLQGRAWLWLMIPLAATLTVAAIFRLYLLDTLPPGLYFDEAYNGADVRSILSGQGLPIFFPGNYGREPLFIYLQTLIVSALGYSVISLRLTAALIGIATVGVVYWGALNLWNYHPQAEQRDGESSGPADVHRTLWIAFVVAAGLAVLYWHVSVSRLGFRAILLPPISTLAIIFLWRGWCDGRRRNFIWAGFWLGVALYTYSSARFLPLVPVAFVALETFISSARPPGASVRRSGIRGLTWIAFIALLTALPLLVTFASQPELIFARLGGVSLFGSPDPLLPNGLLARLAFNINNTLQWFYTVGDFIPRHNLPYRPIHDPLLAILFTIGWLAALWRIRVAMHRLLLVWLLVMILPMLLSVPAPHSLRGVGMIPPLVLLYGVAADSLWRAAHSTRTRIAVLTVVVLMLAGSAYSTAHDYFQEWARHPELGGDFDQDLQLAAEYVQQALPDVQDGAPLVLSRRLYLTPHMRYAVGRLPQVEMTTPIASLPATAKFLVEGNADPDQAAFLIFATPSGPAVSMLEGMPALPAAPSAILASPLQQSAWPSVNIYSGVPVTVTRYAIQYPAGVRFANGLNFVGYEARPVGGPLAAPAFYELTTIWRISPDSSSLFEGLVNMFAHLVYPGAQAQSNHMMGRTPSTLAMYPLSLWQPGEIVDDRRLFEIPEDAVGKAYFEIGLYNPLVEDGLDRVTILNDAGEAVADQVQFGVVPLRIEVPQQDLAGLHSLEVEFEERVRLEGVQFTVIPGQPEQVQVDIGWRTLDRMPTDYTAFIHLLDEDGAMLGQVDPMPGGGDNPTTRWLPGETVRTTAQLTLPADVIQQIATLRIGLYEPVSGRQLAITASNSDFGETGSTFILAPVSVLMSSSGTDK